MARGKKKEALTPEERLQAALVPESEQPYKVPGNWSWIRLELLLQSSKEKTEEFSDANLKYVGLEHMQKDMGVVAYDSAIGVKSLKNVFHPQQILYGKLRPYLNKHDIATFDGICSTDILVFNVTSLCTPEFMNFFLDQDVFIEYAVSNSKGINLPRVSESALLNAKCPLPPFAEQQRIVDRIESLFAKLDEAKQKAQDALDSFETRKAAILHKAFTGELTAQWRQEHGVGMKSWENSTVGNVCHDVKVGIVIKPSQYYTDEEKGTPAFRSANVRENRIDDFDWVYLNHAGMENNSRSIVHTGDVLVVRSGNPGTACVVSEKFDGYNAIDILIAVPDHSRIFSEFLCTYTNSPIGKDLIFENKRGMALAHFNVKGYSGLPIRVPQLNEQTEIVRILDDLLAKEAQAKETAEAVLKQIDLIKKAILARAFRGELGTNDPSEESAVELVTQLVNDELS